MAKPNLFIVGAPKSGTTALSQYLGEHPQVFMSTPKEPHYFATDFPEKRVVTTEEEYLELFDQAGPEIQAVGEASVWYLYSKSALSNIRAFDPSARIVVMLRNPVELVYSMHSQHVASVNEDEADFATAWSLNDERKRGMHVPRHCRDVQLLYYDEIGKLGEQLERVLCLFPAEQVKTIFFEAFASDTGGVYRDLLEFLRLPDNRRTSFPPINQNKRPKSRGLAILTKRTPAVVNKLAMDMKRMLGLKKLGVRQFVNRLNTAVEPRPPLSGEMRRQLVDNYRADVQKLSDLTSCDLSDWLV